MRKARRGMIDRSRAAREGRRFYAFYRGWKDHAAGQNINPFPAGSDDARRWRAGWEFAAADAADRLEAVPPPVCRFGPGGAFTSDWLGWAEQAAREVQP